MMAVSRASFGVQSVGGKVVLYMDHLGQGKFGLKFECSPQIADAIADGIKGEAELCRQGKDSDVRAELSQ